MDSWTHTCSERSLQQPASPQQRPPVPYGSQLAWVGPSRGPPAETCQENWGSCFQEMVCSASQLMASVPGAWSHKAGLAPVRASDCWHLYPCRVLGHCNLCWARRCTLVVWSSFLKKTIKSTEKNITPLCKHFYRGSWQLQNLRAQTKVNHAGLEVRTTFSPLRQTSSGTNCQGGCADSLRGGFQDPVG